MRGDRPMMHQIVDLAKVKGGEAFEVKEENRRKDNPTKDF